MLIPLLTAIHVTIVVLWIGGVAFVTIVIFPMLLKMEDSLEKVLMFQRVESVFARHARYYAVLAGVTGFLLLYLKGMHTLLFTRYTIGISIMLIVWTFYSLVLIFEKRVFKIVFSDARKFDAEKIFASLTRFHWIILGASLAAVFFGVFAGHGGMF
ncbi:MAG: hypothetical protein OHK0032_12640 [Thermodesulfovibrionales bacterium]